MKKIFILLIVLVTCFTLQAQTPITVPNGDFSSGSTLTGTSPWTITGWTISENIGNGAGGNAAVTAASSGVISGALTLIGTNSTTATLATDNANQAALLVESDKIDISSYAGSTTAFTYAFQIKVATVTTKNAPWNVVVKVYDASNAEVLLAISQTKSQGSLKTNAGTYLNASVVGTLLGAASANVKYITIQVHLGQMLANTPTLDTFTLNAAGAAASTTLTQPVSTALSYEIGNGPSAEQSFQVAGANLGSNNITVTPGANIELSSNNSTFASSAITLTPASGTVATTTLYARLIAGLSLGSAGGNATRQVNVAATGTTTKQIQFTGNVTGITSSVAGGSGISYIQGAGPSAEKTITVQGGGLTADVVVTPGSNIEISTTTGTGFASTPITLTQAGGIVASTPIYARLIAGLSGGTYNDATAKVTTSSTGFTSKEIQFTGTVSATVSATQNISDLVLSGAATVNIADGGELNINQNSSSVTMTVSPLAKVTLPDNTTLTSSSITLQSNAGGTATFVDLNNTSPQTVTGTVQQYVDAGRNWYMGSPVTTGNSSMLSLGDSVVQYNEVLEKWEKIIGNLTAGRGYIQTAVTSHGSSGTVNFNGTLNSGTVTVPVTRTESGSSRGFNLVANPYPSYLDWSLVKADGANANIGTTMWFRTKTVGGLYTFSTYNSSGNQAVENGSSTKITKFIPPMQAFWIRVNSGTASTNITFKNSMRAHKDDNGNIFKAPKLNTQQLLRLQISNGTYSDEAVVYFNTDASNAFDSYDSQKMFEIASATKPEIYTQIGSEQLVINGLNTIPYDAEIPLGLITKQAGNFSIAANELLNFESGTRVMLKDKLNPAIETELTPETVYNFNAPITAASTDRFSLIFRAPGVATATNNLGNINAQVFVNAANQIAIVAPEKSSYSIYNAVGQLIDNGIVNSKLITHNSKLSAGVYVIRVNNQSTRVIVK